MTNRIAEVPAADVVAPFMAEIERVAAGLAVIDKIKAEFMPRMVQEALTGLQGWMRDNGVVFARHLPEDDVEHDAPTSS